MLQTEANSNNIVLEKLLIWYVIITVIPISLYIGPVYLTLLRIFLLYSIIPCLTKLIMAKDEKIQTTDIIIFLYVAWTFFSEFTNSGRYNFQEVGSNSVEIVGGYLIGRVYIRNAMQFTLLVRLLVIVVATLLPFSIIETTSKTPFLQEIFLSIPGFTSNPIVTMEERLGLRRVQSVFPHPILYGIFCAIPFTSVLLVYPVKKSKTPKRIAATTVAFATFLSLSSGAILAVALQAGLVTYNKMVKTKAKWLLLTGTIAFVVIVLNIASNRGAVKLFMSYATFSPHNAYYRATSNAWAWKNIVGDKENGIEGAFLFGLSDARNWIRPDWLSGSLDNFWLATALKYGAPATILLIGAIFISIIRNSQRMTKQSNDIRKINLAWTISVLSLCLSLYTVHIWGNVFSFFFFLLGVGQFLSRLGNETKDRQTDEVSNTLLKGPAYRRNHQTKKVLDLRNIKSS